MLKKVLCAMSGGVDSSVASFLLKEAGYEVSGLTMCLGVRNETGSASCCGPKAVDDARRVCDKIGIPHFVLDFSGFLNDYVIAPFVDAYSMGLTPNPCVECNRHLKFGALLDRAESLGFDFVATGHYADIKKVSGIYLLKRPADKAKDQTYFLNSVRPEKLEKTIFPLFNLLKSEVRQIASKAGLPVAEKPESQDICFIPDNDLRNFLDRRIKKTQTEGNLLDNEGNILGRHKGIQYYTIGQRSGFGIGTGKKLYVKSINPADNTIILSEKSGLLSKGLLAGRLNLFAPPLPGQLFAKIRYGHREAPCRMNVMGDKMEVLFENEQEAVTPGQYVAIYLYDYLLAGGVIEKAL